MPFVTADGWVYFRGTDDKLWKVFHDGTRQAQIGGNTTASTPFVTPDGWVYFQGTDNKLWKVFNDGTQQAQIGGNTTASMPFVTPDGWVYFQGTDNKLWKIFHDGTQQAQVGVNTTLSTPRATPAGSSFMPAMREWIDKSWAWFRASGLINPSNLINDSFSESNGAWTCKNNRDTIVWSYNQGVILGALADLFAITNDPGYITQAEILADAFLAHPADATKRPPQSGVNAAGILTEFNDTNPSYADVGIDARQFKGIFIRNLAQLWAKGGRKAKYRDFIIKNAESAVANMNSSYQVGASWSAPVDTADFIRQTSAVDLLNAALLVQAG
jgi:hypothetical protein